MNTTEGLLRLAKVIRWLGYLAAILLMLGAVNESQASGMFALLAVGLGIGIAGWVVAWIIEGFAKPKA